MTASRIHIWFCGPRIDAIPADAVSALSPMLMRIFYPLPDVVSDVTAALPRATCRCQTTKTGAPTSSSAITPRNGAGGVPTPGNRSEATESAEKDRSPERTEQYRLSLHRWEYRIHRDAKAQPETAVESQVAVESDGNAAVQVKRIAQTKQANEPGREGNHTEERCEAENVDAAIKV